MSSSPFGRDLDHPFRQFESRNSNLPIRNVHVRFSEPQTSKNSSDPLNLKISEILGPFSHVSPHLLSELKDSPDNLFGIERPDTPTSPISKKIPFRPTNSLDKVSNNISPKHHRQKPTDKKPVRMMGQNSQTVSAEKKHTSKQSLNATGQKPSQVLKQRKPQLPTDIRSRPTNQHPLHHTGKHGSRTLLSSPSSTNALPHRSSPPNGKKYKHEDKKGSGSSLPTGPSRRPDKFKLKEESAGNSKKLMNNDPSASRTINGDTNNLGQRSPPREDTKTEVVLPGRALKPPSDRPRPAPSRNVGEVTPKKNPLPNLDLSLNRQNLHDDSNDIFALVMEPLPTPLTEIQTPDGIKKFQHFPTCLIRSVPQEKQNLAPWREGQGAFKSSGARPDSSEPDSSDSEAEEQPRVDAPQSRLAPNFLDIVLSSDFDSSDSSPTQPISFRDGGDREDIFLPPSPKRTEKVTESPPVPGARGWGSTPSSDSSNEDETEDAWSKGEVAPAALAPLLKNVYPQWDPPRLPTPPIDVKPTPMELSTELLMHYSNTTTKSRERMSDDSDASSPDRKRLKISISLHKIAVPERTRTLVVSFPRDKIFLPGEKPAESKQTARVHPIRRHPDSGNDLSAAAPTHSYPPRVAEVLPQQKISRKSPRNMVDFQSPDQLRHREPCLDPPVPPQLVTSTPSTASDRCGSNNELSFQPKLTRLSTSRDYLTEAKDLKHQADNFKSTYKKALYYCEAALSFMLYGDQLEVTSKGDAIPTYLDTFDLLDFVLRPCNSRGGLGFTKQCPQLTTICLRCQAVILNRIFIIKQETLKSTHRELHDFFSVYKSDTKAKTPLSNKSPYADGASSWTPNMVQVPQRIATMNSDYLQVLEYQFNSMDLWNKSMHYGENSLALIQRLNESAGKPIEIYSSIRDTTSWCKLGLQLLRKD